MFRLVILLLAIGTLWFLLPERASALPACPGQRFYLKSGEGLDIQFNRRQGCDVRFMAVERGSVERRLIYPSGRTDTRLLTVGQPDISEAWSELPQKAYLRANAETVVRFLAERPPQGTTQGHQTRPNNTPVRVVLHNTTDETITHYWIDPSGREINYGNINPGTFVTLNTFDKHVWRIKRVQSNQTIKQFTVSQHTQVVGIEPRDLSFLQSTAQPSPTKPQAKATVARAANPPQRRTQTFVPTNPTTGTTPINFLQGLWSFVVTLFWLALLGGLFYAGVKMFKATPSIIFSHWDTLIENLQESPMAFYQSVEQAVTQRQVPKANASRVDWPEGAIFSARREYLRVRRKDLIFDICGAPFGNGFFISWWLGPKLGLLGFLYSIPMLGYMFQFLIRPWTYYRIDTALMFQEAIHNAVLEVIDGMTTAKGLRALSENERKPTLKNFFQR